MLRQSLVCVAVENEQRCVTGVINSLQQPVFTQGTVIPGIRT